VWLIIPAFLFLAVCFFFALFMVAGHSTNHGDLVILAGAVLGLPALVVLALAFRQGLGHVRSGLAKLRWWHLPWALLLVGSLVFRIRSASEIISDPVDAWAGFRIGMDTLVAFILLGRLAVRRTNWVGSMLRGVVGAITVFGLVCLASTFWSVFPAWTLYKSGEYLIDVALLAAIVETVESVEEYRRFFNWTWALYGVLLLSVWKDVLLWPKEALYGEIIAKGAAMSMRLDGVLPAVSANDIGAFSAVLGLLSLARLFPASDEKFNKSWYSVVLLGSLVTMVFAQTRSAFAAFVLGGIVILLFSKRSKLMTALAFVGVPIAAIGTMGGLIWSFMERGQSGSQLETMSSRSKWWGFAWETYLEKPFTGMGAYAGGRFAVMQQLGSGTTSTMHSDYLETIVGTGVWGMIALLVTLAAVGWLLLRYVRDRDLDPYARQLAYEGLAIFAFLLFRSIFNDTFGYHPALHFLAILGFAEYLRRRRKAVFQFARAPSAADAIDEPDSQLELVFSGGNPEDLSSV